MSATTVPSDTASAVDPAALTAAAEPVAKHPFLVGLGERVRRARSRRGMTRKAAAAAAGVSERHLANLEYGVGNASILVLLQVAGALQATLAELVGDMTTLSPEWLMIRELLDCRDDATLRSVRTVLSDMLASGTAAVADASRQRRSPRIALIGLRGAGKSTLGARLAADLGFPFIELSREIERIAGCSVAEIQALYGVNAYRRYERRALEEMVQTHAEAVIATPGGMVSDAATFTLLLRRCTSVWLQAKPEDHMRRVIEQGDMRPMGASREAMDDLKGILAGRSAFYAKADFRIDTSAAPLETTFDALRRTVRQALSFPLEPQAANC